MNKFEQNLRAIEEEIAEGGPYCAHCKFIQINEAEEKAYCPVYQIYLQDAFEDACTHYEEKRDLGLEE